jgi:hypothetical protein
VTKLDSLNVAIAQVDAADARARALVASSGIQIVKGVCAVTPEPGSHTFAAYLEGSAEASDGIEYGLDAPIEGDIVLVARGPLKGRRTLLSILSRERTTTDTGTGGDGGGDDGGGTTTPVGLPVVVLRASGGDDARAFQAAVDEAEPGTLIELPDPLYLFQTAVDGVCLDITSKQIRWRGRGAERMNIGLPNVTGTTTTIKCQVSGATMVRYRPLWPNATTYDAETFGGSWDGVSLGGQGVAAVVLEIQGGVNQIVLRDMWIGHGTEHALLTGRGNDTATINSSHSAYRLRFENVTFRQYTGAGTDMILMEGNPNAIGGEHTYHVSFMDCAFIYSTGSTAVRLTGSDDVMFYVCGWATSNPDDANTYSLRFDGSNNGQFSDTTFLIGCYGANLAHMKAEGTGINRPGRGHFAWPISMTDGKMRPEWEIGGTLWYGDSLGRHNLRRDGRTSSEIEEDFYGGLTYAAGGTGGPGVGDTGWRASLGAAGSLAALDSTLHHPGIVRLSTGAGASVATLAQRVDGAARSVLLAGQTFFAYFVFRLTADHASMSCRVGFSNAPTSFAPTSGVYIEHLAADGANWYAVNRLAGSEAGSRTLLGALNVGTGAGNWVTLEMHRRYTGAIGFSLVDQESHASQVTHTTNETTGALTPVFQIINSASVDSSLDVDYFQFAPHGLIR